VTNFYADLAEWWPLFSPPSQYVEEAADVLSRLGSSDRRRRLLELGSGGGSLASHLKSHFEMTLTDLSDGMLAVSREVNPECEHIRGDMRTLRLGRTFDVVLIHDAIMYATTADDLRSTLETAATHCASDGLVAVLPDYVRETFESGTEEGGEDAEDGRGFRFLAWCFDPDPADSTYVVDYAFLMRDASGETRVAHDRHVEGLFSREEWMNSFAAAGLDVTRSIDPWNRDVFIAKPRPS
jgi:trans-aconitate methyltransferase